MRAEEGENVVLGCSEESLIPPIPAVEEEHPKKIRESEWSERARRRKRKNRGRGTVKQRRRDLSSAATYSSLCHWPRWEVRIFRHFFPTIIPRAHLAVFHGFIRVPSTFRQRHSVVASYQTTGINLCMRARAHVCVYVCVCVFVCIYTIFYTPYIIYAILVLLIWMTDQNFSYN